MFETLKWAGKESELKAWRSIFMKVSLRLHAQVGNSVDLLNGASA
jgi:hypothetical protein